MAKESEPIAYVPEEQKDSYSDDSLFKIKSWGADLSFRELIARYDDDELLKPEIQRNYIWDKTEASRFIDSLLLGLPVPSIFLARTANEKLLIIDGFQRLMTVRDFVRGKFKDGKAFKLTRNEKIHERWRGKAFAELGEPDQRRIRNTTIHAIIFDQEHPANDDTSLFQIFERINTSGRTLLPQEIRNCVSQGRLNSLLLKLNKLAAWRALFGVPEPDLRMRDVEFILRFFALSSRELKAEQQKAISLKRFLDLYMLKYARLSEEQADEFEARFVNAVGRVRNLFGDSAFHNISPSDSKKLVPKFSPTIFDSITIAADFANARDWQPLVGEPEDRRRALLMNKDYRFAITQETMTKVNITMRIKLACKFLFGIKYE